MITCHICYQTHFANWVDYDNHYTASHAENSKYVPDLAKAIRAKALATPLNVTGLSKRAIVEAIEYLYPESFLTPANASLSEYYMDKVMSKGGR